MGFLYIPLLCQGTTAGLAAASARRTAILSDIWRGLMSNPFEVLEARGFQVEFRSHALGILKHDFPDAAAELVQALSCATIPIEEIIAGGGGEAKGTQRLRRALTALGWVKTKFKVEKLINGVRSQSQSHEVDHVKTFGDAGRVALEIEWNNKDPFYDRDLENFKRLHADGAISVGVVVTRGRSLHENMRNLVRRFIDERQIQTVEELAEWGYEPTKAQRKGISSRMARIRNPMTFREAFTDKFVADKFGEATTHWKKLEVRLDRGVGNPCPLILIGLPDGIVTFDEGKAALAEVEAAEEQSEH